MVITCLFPITVGYYTKRPAFHEQTATESAIMHDVAEHTAFPHKPVHCSFRGIKLALPNVDVLEDSTNCQV